MVALLFPLTQWCPRAAVLWGLILGFLCRLMIQRFWICVCVRERRSSACQCKWHLICWVMEMHWHSLVSLAHSYGFSILYSIPTGCWAGIKEMAQLLLCHCFYSDSSPKMKNLLWFNQTHVVLNLYLFFWIIFQFIFNLTTYFKGIRCFSCLFPKSFVFGARGFSGALTNPTAMAFFLIGMERLL